MPLSVKADIASFFCGSRPQRKGGSDSGQGLVTEAEGVALACGNGRLLCVRVCLGKACQRLRLLYAETAVPQTRGAHLGAVQLNALVLGCIEYAQVIPFAGSGMGLSRFYDFASSFQSQPPFYNSGWTGKLSLHNCRKSFNSGFPVTLL